MGWFAENLTRTEILALWRSTSTQSETLHFKQSHTSRVKDDSRRARLLSSHPRDPVDAEPRLRGLVRRRSGEGASRDPPSVDDPEIRRTSRRMVRRPGHPARHDRRSCAAFRLHRTRWRKQLRSRYLHPILRMPEPRPQALLPTAGPPPRIRGRIDRSFTALTDVSHDPQCVGCRSRRRLVLPP